MNPVPMIVVGNGIIGGMEQYVLSMLDQFRRRGRRAVVAAPFAGEFTGALHAAGHPPEDLILLDMPPAISIASLASLTFHLRARGIDLVHSHLVPADALGAAAAAQVGIPAVSTLHGTVRCKEELLLHSLYGLRYVAVSLAGRASALAMGLPPEAVGHIANGVDVRRLDPATVDGSAVRLELDLPDNAVLVTCVSRLSPEKNPAGFLDAAGIAAGKDPRLVFALVGGGPLEPMLRQRIDASRLGDRFRMLGPRLDVERVLAASDLVALPSRTESLPFAVLEALAMEVPVIACDVGGVSEAVVEGVNGHLVPPDAPGAFARRIVELAADPDRRRRMGAAGRAKVKERFRFDRTMDDLLALYDRLVDRGPAPLLVRRGTAPKPEDESLPAVVDAHLHLRGDETPGGVLETLEACGLEAACLIAPFLPTDSWIPARGRALHAANQRLIELVAEDGERLRGLVALDPREPQALRWLLDYADQPGIAGVKLVPYGWRPDGPEVLRLYEACADLGLPILFHSGIFIASRTSDACRPALYEAVRAFPSLTVVLAHLGWPWVDEAIAVALMDPLAGRRVQIHLDLSPGTPPAYRAEALKRAFATLGSVALLFGSDRFFPLDPDDIRTRVVGDLAALRSAGAGDGDVRAVFGDNARRVFATRSAARPAETSCTTS